MRRSSWTGTRRRDAGRRGSLQIRRRRPLGARRQKRIGQDLRASRSGQEGLHARRLDHLRVAAQIDPPSAQVRAVFERDSKGRSGAVSVGGWTLGDAWTKAKVRVDGGEPVQWLVEVQPAGIAAAVVQVDAAEVAVVQRIAHDSIQRRESAPGAEQQNVLLGPLGKVEAVAERL